MGDEHAINSPLTYTEDLFGLLTFASLPSTVRHVEQSLLLDLSQSETKAIKTLWSFAAKSSLESELETPLQSRLQSLHSKSLFDTVYGEKISSNQWVKQEEQQWHSQKFQHVFKTLSNPSGYTLDMTVEFTGKSSSLKSRRFGSSIAYGMDTLNSHRATVMMERRSEQQLGDSEQNFVLCADIDAKFPEFLAFQRKEMIKDESEPVSTIKIGFGKSCTDDRKVTISVSEMVQKHFKNQF